MSELENAIEASQPSDVTVSSTDEAGNPAAPAETPVPKVEPKEPPFNEHPRWIERQRELEQLRLQNQQLMELAQRTQPAAPQQADPYAGMTPEEKTFWERNRQIAREEAMKVAQEKEQNLHQELKETKEAVSLIAYERFQMAHPDIKAGSDEENKIAQFFQRGYSLDDAYKVVMFDKIGTQKAQAAKEVLVNKVQQKIAANVETKGIAQTSNLGPKANFREAMRKEMEKAGF